MAARPLTAQQVRFARHYAETGNATEAYKQAGFVTQGKREGTIRAAAATLLTKANIRDLVRDMRDQTAATEAISLARVARELGRIAFGRRAAAYDESGNLLPPQRWTAEVEAAIAGVETETVVTGEDSPPTIVRKVKFERRPEALKQLAALLGYQKGDDSAPVPAGSTVVILPPKVPVTSPPVADHGL